MKATSARAKRKNRHAAKPQLLVERSAHVEHRGREGEDMAYTWPPRRRSASGFLHAKGIVGELINVWGSGCVGQPHLWLGHVAPRGR